jgi:tRNA 2-thiocytidine biosynthesis protein TtcA
MSESIDTPKPSKKLHPGRVKLRGALKYVYKQMGRTMAEHAMIGDNDHLLVAITGSPQSLALLRLLLIRKYRIPVKFSLTACIIDTGKFNKDKLIIHLQKNEITWCEKTFNLSPQSDQYLTEYRKLLVQAATEGEANKIVTGDNIDDITETTIQNLLFHGQISTQKPVLSLAQTKLTLLRPLCFVENRNVVRLAKKLSLPDLEYIETIDRQEKEKIVDELVKDLEGNCRYVRKNVFKGVSNIKEGYLV